VLIAKWAPDAMRVEVASSSNVHETDNLPAFDRGADLTGIFVGSFSNLPQAIRRSIVFGGSYKLLPTSRLELPLIALEKILASRFDVGELDGRSTSDMFL